jgi:hypothetical protein
MRRRLMWPPSGPPLDLLLTPYMTSWTLLTGKRHEEDEAAADVAPLWTPSGPPTDPLHDLVDLTYREEARGG